MASLLANGGKFGIGTDSNIHISLPEELRTLEYSQRLFHKKRLIISDINPSNGETVFSKSCLGGSRALCHGNGMLDIGSPADILALDENNPGLYERDHKQILDGFVFCGDNRMIKDLWVGGKLVVSDGRHFKHDNIKEIQ